MKKRVIALFTLVVVTISTYSQAAGQSKCTLTETNSPSVRGLRLGMSTQELLALFPGSAARWAKQPKDVREAREKAMAQTNSEPAFLAFEPADAAKDRFSGVDSVSIALYKDRVVEYTVQYTGTVWTSIDEWIGRLSETLTLPGSRDWEVGPSENPNKVLKCSGVEIEAAIQGGGSSISIRNVQYPKGLGDRSNSGAEQKRREFKP